MSERKVERGQPLEELVKGSLNYTLHQIRKAFYAQFGRSSDEEGVPYAWIEEVFSDHVIATSDDLAVDEYYYVSYSRGGDSYVFAPREEWEVVELAYRPRSTLQEALDAPQKFVEVVEHAVTLVESQDEGRWIEGTGITADVVNGNGRRYPRHVLREAVERLQSHLHESAGQGRLGQIVTGEAEHPTSKGSRHPQFLETIVNWNAGSIRFDEATGRVFVRGRILETSKGKDAIIIMEGGVLPGLSMRGYGSTITVKEGKQSTEEVDALTITGFDLLAPGTNSDPNGGITVLESRHQPEEHKEEQIMDLEELRTKYPHLAKQIEEEHDVQKRAELEEALRQQAEEDARIQQAVAEREAQLRNELGIGESEPLEEALRQRDSRLQELESARRAQELEGFIESQIGELSYPDVLKTQFIEAVRAAKPESEDGAKRLIEGKRKEYDAIMAGLTLQERGYGGGLQVLGPVIEQQAGVPAFARAAFELQESLARTGEVRVWSPRKPATVNELFAAKYLQRFDQVYKHQLLQESRLFEEAETTTDLNLPYSVMRAIVAEAFPELVATSLFDVDMIDASPTYIYYETYVGETGYTGTVTGEAVTASNPLGSWVELDYKRLTPGTVVVTNTGASATYLEGTDYVIDYGNGRLMALSGGSITAGQSLLADYSYTAIRKGEMQPIERGKMQLGNKVLTMAADRLATEISREAIVFSRSQIGWDATTRTLASLVRQVRRKVDQGLLYAALTAALRVANNSGGTWTAATDSVAALVKYMGQAKVKVANRYYEPTAYLMSVTNADRLSNWDGFKRDGFPDAVLNSNGFVGRVKGLPVYQSTEFSDGYIEAINRQLVIHRVQVPMELRGPFPSYDISGGTSRLIAADQYYAEEFNGTDAPVPEKGAVVKIA